MDDKRKCFVNYLKKIDLFSEVIQDTFEIYFNELQRENLLLNLFSRKMELDDIWTKHFMDSVSIFEVFRDFKTKEILDFGTGGGLPGVPIRILCPESKMTLMDSTQKKIESLKRMMYKIDLANVSFLANRIEDKKMEAYKGFFDIVVCRSVKITEKLYKAILSVLKKGGKIFLWKASILEIGDTIISLEENAQKKYKLENNRLPFLKQKSDFLASVIIHTLDLKQLGERRIIEINYG